MVQKLETIDMVRMVIHSTIAVLKKENLKDFTVLLVNFTKSI
jgi:hypothetical protein